MISSKHHGRFTGPNRLWFEGPEPERSQGSMVASATKLAYAWSFRDKGQEGQIELFGLPGALRADWRDTWHAAKGMALHGLLEEGVIRLFGTYPAGDGPEWGWRIEIDCRDPEHLTLRMFNVAPDDGVSPAVDLRGARSAS